MGLVEEYPNPDARKLNRRPMGWTNCAENFNKRRERELFNKIDLFSKPTAT
jgi:hypothetical protein